MSSIDSFADDIYNALQSYSTQVDNVLQEELIKLADDTKNELRTDPSIPKRTGKYKKSFYVNRTARGRGYIRLTVANKLFFLTHVLENGHENVRSLGKANGTISKDVHFTKLAKDDRLILKGDRTPGHPHWKPAQDRLNHKQAEIFKKIGEVGK